MIYKGGTAIVEVSFTDENGDSVVPNTVEYTLKKEGVVVNSKEDISVTPSASVSISLVGDDLPQGDVYFYINGTYNSSAGDNLPLRGFTKITVVGEL